MEVRMEHTEGLGGPAEVWVDGFPLTVCDSVSDPQKRCPPGVLQGVRFGYMTAEKVSWDQAAGENPSKKKMLDPVGRWSYVGYGQVVSIMPVVIDFGLLRMEDANWTSDESLVGQFVKVPIDRLEIAPANLRDYPENPSGAT